LVVVTENFHRQELIEIDHICRTHNPPIGFIYGASLGLFGCAFVDFGDSFTCFDKNGEQNRNTIVVDVT